MLRSTQLSTSCCSIPIFSNALRKATERDSQTTRTNHPREGSKPDGRDQKGLGSREPVSGAPAPDLIRGKADGRAGYRDKGYRRSNSAPGLLCPVAHVIRDLID